jgi:hypothetical protein
MESVWWWLSREGHGAVLGGGLMRGDGEREA